MDHLINENGNGLEKADRHYYEQSGLVSAPVFSSWMKRAFLAKIDAAPTITTMLSSPKRDIRCSQSQKPLPHGSVD